MTQSMSRVAKCIDNGPKEGFCGILKRERYYGKRFESRESLVRMIEEYIFYYNTQRLQRNLGVLTPMEKYESYRLLLSSNIHFPDLGSGHTIRGNVKKTVSTIRY